METKIKENQSSITEIMKLLTPSKAANPSSDVILVMAYPVGGSGK